MSTTSGKKRKTPESDAIAENTNNFQSIVKRFASNQKHFFDEWIDSNGIPETDLVEGAEELTTEERGLFTDEMSKLFGAYVYDTILHLKEGEDGFFVPTLKSRTEDNKQVTFYEEINKGPIHFVSENPSPAEGDEESELKKKARKLHGYNQADLSRSCGIGGAIKASPQAKELLGHLMNLYRAHLIQRSMIAASSDNKKTIKAKHVKTAIATEGITAV
ncbi:MAG: hypothetical protein ACTSUE_06505 [Promethearchaeota archaeon]